MNRTLSLAAATTAALALAGLASADTVATDSYVIGTDPAAGEYQGSVALKNQPANLANFGFVDGGYTSGSGTSQFSATANGLNAPALGELSSTSGKVNYSAAPIDGNYRVNARGLTGVPASDTYWITHVVNRGGIPGSGGTGYALTGFGNFVAPDAGTTSGNLAGLFVGFAQDGVADNFGSLVIRYRDGTSTTSDEVLIDGAAASTFGTSYTVVMKVDVNVGGGSADDVSWWVDPANYGSEDTLDATAALSGSFSSFALSGAGDLQRLNYGARDWNGNVFFDGARLSTDLAGLNAAAIPEPASLALLGLGGLAMLRRRR